MKKRIISLIVLLTLAVCMCAGVSAKEYVVIEHSGIPHPVTDVPGLIEDLEEASKLAGCDIILAYADGTNIEKYTESLYKNGGYSKDCVLLVHFTDTDETCLYTSGKGSRMLNEVGRNRLTRLFPDFYSHERYVKYCTEMLTEYTAEKPYGYARQAFIDILRQRELMAVIAAVVSLAVGTITAAVVVRRRSRQYMPHNAEINVDEYAKVSSYAD